MRQQRTFRKTRCQKERVKAIESGECSNSFARSGVGMDPFSTLLLDMARGGFASHGQFSPAVRVFWISLCGGFAKRRPSNWTRSWQSKTTWNEGPFALHVSATVKPKTQRPKRMWPGESLLLKPEMYWIMPIDGVRLVGSKLLRYCKPSFLRCIGLPAGSCFAHQLAFMCLRFNWLSVRIILYIACNALSPPAQHVELQFHCAAGESVCKEGL